MIAVLTMVMDPLWPEKCTCEQAHAILHTTSEGSQSLIAHL